MNRHTSASAPEKRYLVGIPNTKQSYSQLWSTLDSVFRSAPLAKRNLRCYLSNGMGRSSRLSLTCGNAELEEQIIGHIHFNPRLGVFHRDSYIEYRLSRQGCDALNQSKITNACVRSDLLLASSVPFLRRSGTELGSGATQSATR
jgi:hypothetical protein